LPAYSGSSVTDLSSSGGPWIFIGIDRCRKWKLTSTLARINNNYNKILSTSSSLSIVSNSKARSIKLTTMTINNLDRPYKQRQLVRGRIIQYKKRTTSLTRTTTSNYCPGRVIQSTADAFIKKILNYHLKSLG
jgi:hypothetical protein